MIEPLVLYDKIDSIAVLTLNRPSALNAVNLAMRDELWGLLLAVRDDPDVRVAVLRGAGERGFCAGADIKEFGTAPSVIEARRARQERDLWGLMIEMETPLIAQIHGWALGAGCEMSLLCDIRIASDDARMGLPEVTLGYIPSAGGTQTLPRTIAHGDAMQMILSGDPIDAATAQRLRLVHRVVPRAALESEVMATAEAIAARPPATIQMLKRVLTQSADLPLAAALAFEARQAGAALAGSRRDRGI
ncbi:MAG: enoyl-CoA hydratase/isomerase family protein [Dehalococcoidia bacterium]